MPVRCWREVSGEFNLCFDAPHLEAAPVVPPAGFLARAWAWVKTLFGVNA
jgi:hypothetical protein